MKLKFLVIATFALTSAKYLNKEQRDAFLDCGKPACGRGVRDLRNLEQENPPLSNDLAGKAVDVKAQKIKPLINRKRMNFSTDFDNRIMVPNNSSTMNSPTSPPTESSKMNRSLDNQSFSDQTYSRGESQGAFDNQKEAFPEKPANVSGLAELVGGLGNVTDEYFDVLRDDTDRQIKITEGLMKEMEESVKEHQEANARTKRLLYGDVAKERQFPFFAALRSRTHTHICGAAIITEYFLITAAHCIENYQPNLLQVYVGTTGNYKGIKGIYHSIHKVTVHPAFKHDLASGYDIGVIELTKPLRIGKTIKSINLPIGITVNPGDNVLATGWGYFGFGALSYFEATIISNKECYEEVKYIGPEQICISDGHEKRFCTGDSGSPLVYTIRDQSYVVGLTSWARGQEEVTGGRSCSFNRSVVYSNVSYYVHWIKTVIQKKRT